MQLTERQIIKRLKGRISFENISSILNDMGYVVVLYNNPVGDEELDRYNLKDIAKDKSGFTYSEIVHIVFINSLLSITDKIYVLLHELGHVALGHIGSGNLELKDKILIDLEADCFAYSILTKCGRIKNKHTIPKRHNYIKQLLKERNIKQ